MNCGVHCRRYELICQERTSARAQFRQRHPHRNGKRGAPFPLGLEEIPPFAKWFEEDVARSIQGDMVPEDVQASSKLPSIQAKKFKSMYAYRAHFRCKSAERRSTSTCDPGVATIFQQACRSGR